MQSKQHTGSNVNPATSDSGTDRIRGGIVAYMIGHEPDKEYLERLLPQLEEVAGSIAFVETDRSEVCIKVVDELYGINADFEKFLFQSKELFDFSKCRNAARQMAESKGAPDWLLWLDCDDLIPDPQSILKALQDPRLADCDAIAIPYDVGPHCDNVLKKRLHRPGKWKWINKVHEELVFTGEGEPKIGVLQDCVIVHGAGPDKSNHEFHISLLKEGCRNAPNEYSYIGKEYFHHRKYEEALPWLEKAVAIHPYPCEQYLCRLYAGISYMNLGQTRKAVKALQECSRMDPSRRDAWFYLAQHYGKAGTPEDREKALAYISCCNAQINRRKQGQQRDIYESAGYKLHAKLLQSFGLNVQALQVMAKIANDHIDEESKDIILTSEQALKDQAIKSRDNHNG
jgi:hypothetical protein